MLDIRHALRQFRRTPGFTFVALLTLGVGIGACTAIFSVVNSVLLRPLPYPGGERLVVMHEVNLPRFPEFPVAPGKYYEWLKQATSFESMGSLREDAYNLTGVGEPLRIAARRVTASLLPTLRTFPALGRAFSDDEDQPGKDNVVILSHEFWTRKFGAQAEILNHTIQLNGHPFTVVGVMPRGFQIDGPWDVFTPLALDAEDRQDRRAHYLTVVARLNTGVSVEQADAEARVTSARLAERYPDTSGGWSAKVVPMREAQIHQVRPTLYSLLGAVAFLLLIACANVANLILARATARSREIALRASLGATRARTVRQLLTETVLLSLAGGAIGLLVAHLGINALMRLAPENLPRVSEVSVDGMAIGIAFALSLVTGVGCGLAPALHATRMNLNEMLKEGGRSSGGRRGGRLRGALVVGEIAVALVLLAGCGLLMRSFARLQTVDPGFQPADAMTVEVALSPERYPTEQHWATFTEQMVKRLAALPGVQSVGAAQLLPFAGARHIFLFKIDGRPEVDIQLLPSTYYYAVSSDYFRAMGIPLKRGRFFDSHVGPNTGRVAIINDSMARKMFPGEDPIGKRLTVTNGPDTWREIVGVVGDVKHDSLDGESPLQTYEPLAQQSFDRLVFVVRQTRGSANLAAGIRAALEDIDREQPITRLRPLADSIGQSMSRQRFAMLLFAAFSLVALILAGVGVYGVMSYSVTQRAGEFSIRVALGAPPGNVLRLAFRQGARLIAVGLVVGVGVGLLLTQLLGALLFEVSATDPVTFGVMALLLGVSAGLACLVPALRAINVDPARVLGAQ